MVNVYALVVIILASIGVNTEGYDPRMQYKMGPFSNLRFRNTVQKVESLKASLKPDPPLSFAGFASAPTPSQTTRVYHVTAYGADPTGKVDSLDAILEALLDAFKPSDGKELMPGIPDLGGAVLDLDGGSYIISGPLRMPSSGGGNLVIRSGSLRASDDFPTDRHLIELWPASAPKLGIADERDEAHSPFDESLDSFSRSYEFITLKDLLLDCSYRGGGIAVINSLRTSIDNCYIAHFGSSGIYVQGGHETYIRGSYLGQHITAGGDPGERNFSGTGIILKGNDNAVTDVVIFSAAVGILIAGQANILTGVHCYNKATGFGGTGIYILLPGLSQTRIVNCYLDYTGIVAEDPVQLHISNSFFLGSAFVLLKSIKGKINGLTVVDNSFSGDNRGIGIVQLDQSRAPFSSIDQVHVDRNDALGMALKSTAATLTLQGNSSTWTADFNPNLLFPNRINQVQYSLLASSGSLPRHVLRSVSNNKVVIESDSVGPATMYVTVDQS